MSKKMLLTLAAAAVAGLAASSVAVAHDPSGQGKKDDATTAAATTAAATTASSPAAKPRAKNFTAKLRGAKENPAVTTDAVGRSKLQLKRNGDLGWFLNASNIEDVTAAHIHCGAPNQNGPVVVGLYGGPTTTPHGRFAKGTVPAGALAPVQASTCPDSSGNPIDIPDDADDIVDSLDDLVWLMRRGHAYVNVHTTANPGGEIRGQVKPLGPKS